MTDSLNRHLKHSWRVGCFVSDPYEACSTPARERKGEDIIGAAYDRGHSRPRMWAQYAEDYHGACLVFDRARLDAAIRDAATREGQQVLHDKVTYRNPNVVANLSRPDALTMSLDRILQIGPEAAVKEHVALHWRELFMLKSKDWEQERELRWLVSADSDRDFFVSMDDACVGIALGDRAPLVAGNATSAYAETRDTSLAIMTWKNGFPQPSPTHWRPLKTPLPPRPPLHQRLRTRTKTIIDCLKDGSLKT